MRHAHHLRGFDHRHPGGRSLRDPRLLDTVPTFLKHDWRYHANTLVNYSDYARGVMTQVKAILESGLPDYAKNTGQEL